MFGACRAGHSGPLTLPRRLSDTCWQLPSAAFSASLMLPSAVETAASRDDVQRREQHPDAREAVRYPRPRVHRFQTNRPHLAFVPSPTERSPSSPHPAWGYPVENRIWFFPRISPCSGPWWLSPRGVGTGEGASPAPDKMSPKTLMRPRSATGSTDENPRRVITAGTSRLEARQPGLRFRFRWDFHVKVPLRPPTPPALRAHPPPPPGGEGSHGDTRWKAVPGGGTGGGFPGEEGSASPDPAPPRALPVQWTVAAIAPW